MKNKFVQTYIYLRKVEGGRQEEREAGREEEKETCSYLLVHSLITCSNRGIQGGVKPVPESSVQV